MHYCTKLFLLNVRWSATTRCFIKALKVSSFYRDKKKVSPIKHTHTHTATKRQRHNHAFILSLQGFAIVMSHQWAFPNQPLLFNEALFRLYATTPIAWVRVLHFWSSAASLTVYFIHFGCCDAPTSSLPWSTQCIKARYSNAGVLWSVLLLVLDIKCNVWFCHLGKLQVWLYCVGGLQLRQLDLWNETLVAIPRHDGSSFPCVRIPLPPLSWAIFRVCSEPSFFWSPG